MTPFRGRGFLAHLTKKSWIKPEVTRFETLEELLDHYRKDMTHSEFDELVKHAERLQRSGRGADPSQHRKSSKR
jgi:hypothetical protein